jgi:hypothetical protein
MRRRWTSPAMAEMPTQQRLIEQTLGQQEPDEGAAGADGDVLAGAALSRARERLTATDTRYGDRSIDTAYQPDGSVPRGRAGPTRADRFAPLADGAHPLASRRGSASSVTSGVLGAVPG